jgi:hypothetical protein
MFKDLSVQEPVYPFSKFFRIGTCEECVGRRAGQGFKGLSEGLKRLYDAHQRTHKTESFLRANSSSASKNAPHILPYPKGQTMLICS